MKLNSKILGILTLLFAGAIVISAAAAADLVDDDFNSEHFSIDVPSNSNFSQGSNTGIKLGDVAIHMALFQNLANNSKDVSAVLYFHDDSDDKNLMDDFVADLEKDGKVIEETDKYKVIENEPYEGWNFGSDSSNSSDNVFSFITSFFGSEDGVNVTTNEGNLSLSENDLNVSLMNDTNVSFTKDEIAISDNENQLLGEDDLVSEGYMVANIHDDAYAVYLNNSDNSKVIVIAGDDLGLLKAMADSVSFN